MLWDAGQQKVGGWSKPIGGPVVADKLMIATNTA
jgi:hypothetical protein